MPTSMSKRYRGAPGRGLASRVVAGLEIRPRIDLSQHLTASEFDDAMRALSEVVEGSASLSLDDARDRKALIDRLSYALGAVVA